MERTCHLLQDKIQPTIGVAVITHHAKKHLSHCLPPLLNSSVKPRVLVVNSSSNDGTVEEAIALGAEVLVIPRNAFNHGSTRERARKFLGTDVVVMITPDAYAENAETLSTLLEPIFSNKASVSYARQLSHNPSCFFESFPRHFNYPEQSQLRSIADLEKYGAYTFFCSDSFAAYNNAALDEIGGFDRVLLGEDSVAVAKLLKKGHKIAYVAEARVRHSHKYSLAQEFKRNFDTGLARTIHAEILCHQNDTKRGKEFVKALCKELVKTNPLLLPYAVIQTLVKYLGYKIGAKAVNAPLWIKKRLSSQDFYWQENAL